MSFPPSRRDLIVGLAGLAGVAPLSAGPAQAADPPAPTVPGWPKPNATFQLWPNRTAEPDASAGLTMTQRSTDPTVSDRIANAIKAPRIDVFRPLRPNGAAVLVIPGGGYLHVVVDREGYEVAAGLAELGLTAFVLFYRLPREGWQEGASVALADAQRAMRLIRARAGTLGYDPERIGVMGMSAGGHLCADLATRHHEQLQRPIDEVDRLSARPMLAAPLYPVVSMTDSFAHAPSRERLLGANPSDELARRYSPDRSVDNRTPPLFIVHAEDDAVVPVENSLALRAAARAAGVSAETHLFEHGGHGFAIRRAIGKPVGQWPNLFLAWARTKGMFDLTRP